MEFKVTQHPPSQSLGSAIDALQKSVASLRSTLASPGKTSTTTARELVDLARAELRGWDRLIRAARGR